MSRSIEVPESVSSDIAPSTDEAILRRASSDFGGIERGSSTGVMHAGSTSDVVRAIRVARSEGMSLTPRAEGLSQSGQAIARNNWTLSLAGLVGVEYTSDLLVTCGAGTSWRQLVHLMAPEGVVPKVLPMNLDISVGGTLSAGGLGASSHRFGPCVANVSALEVVTGEGEVVRCSRTENQDAYDAALAGLGRSVVITSATLELRRNKQAQ